MTEALEQILAWAATPLGLISCAIAAIMLAVIFAPVAPPRHGRRDRTRIFTADQKRAGHARAGGRCEMEVLPGIRCRGSGTAADHWFPYSKGGATSMANFVSACTWHNLAKSNRCPTRSATARLEARRRRYFPPGEPRDAGQWLP